MWAYRRPTLTHQNVPDTIQGESEDQAWTTYCRSGHTSCRPLHIKMFLTLCKSKSENQAWTNICRCGHTSCRPLHMNMFLTLRKSKSDNQAWTTYCRCGHTSCQPLHIKTFLTRQRRIRESSMDNALSVWAYRLPTLTHHLADVHRRRWRWRWCGW